MKSLIESIKLHWADFIGLFNQKPDYYYKMDAKQQDPVKVCCFESGEDCSCKTTSDYMYEEPAAVEPAAVEPAAAEEVTAEPLRTKEQVKLLSKLELQVMAENAGIKLSSKEKKQQILNKLVKHYDL
jgi:hypothetical protein